LPVREGQPFLSQDLKAIVKCISKSPPSYRVEDGDEFLQRQANEFLKSIEIRALSWRTVRAYAFDLVALMRWLQYSGINFGELTQASLLKYIEYQKARHHSPRSINRELSTCQQYFRFIYDRSISRGVGVTLPAGNYQGRGYDNSIGMRWRKSTGHLSLRVKVPQTIVEPLSHDEVMAFMKSMRHYRDLAIVFTMTLSGLRSVEIIQLELNDINFERSEMLIRGKGNRQRVLPMAPGLIDLIKRYLTYERPSFSPSQHLFVNHQGRRLGEAMTSKGIISLFNRRRKKPGLKRANPHRFRHTFGANMARSGMHLLVIQKLMGHADPRMTTKYIALDISDVALEYKKIMERIGDKYADQSRPKT
jgi:site-specific recombinase XerD